MSRAESTLSCLKKTQHLQFPEDSFARDQILEDVGHLFECYSLSISWICY